MGTCRICGKNFGLMGGGSEPYTGHNLQVCNSCGEVLKKIDKVKNEDTQEVKDLFVSVMSMTDDADVKRILTEYSKSVISDETAELRCGYFDLKKQEELKKCEVNLKKDKTLKKEYDKINARVKFTDLSMEDLKKKFKIKYDNSAENYSSFKERATLFGHKGYFKYYVKNPNEDDYDSDFIGQICFEEFRFDKLTKKDEKEIISQLKRMYGKGIKDTYTVRSWYDSYSRCTAEKIGDEFYLRFSRNFQYCFINPKFNSTDSTKKILAYGDCNEKMFKFEKEEGYKRVTNISTIDTCWKLAQEEILSQLKSPSSAQFGSAAPASSDVRVTRYNDEYYVESWVDAENSFGATIRTNFEVTLRKNGRSFEVESSRIY